MRVCKACMKLLSRSYAVEWRPGAVAQRIRDKDSGKQIRHWVYLPLKHSLLLAASAAALHSSGNGTIDTGWAEAAKQLNAEVEQLAHGTTAGSAAEVLLADSCVEYVKTLMQQRAQHAAISEYGNVRSTTQTTHKTDTATSGGEEGEEAYSTTPWDAWDDALCDEVLAAVNASLMCLLN